MKEKPLSTFTREPGDKSLPDGKSTDVSSLASSLWNHGKELCRLQGARSRMTKALPHLQTLRKEDAAVG